MEFKTIQDSLL